MGGITFSVNSLLSKRQRPLKHSLKISYTEKNGALIISAAPRNSQRFSNNQTAMKVLVLNRGSSTVKFQVIEAAETSTPTNQDHKLASGLVDHLGDETEDSQ